MADIRMPKMGDGMEEGTINRWLKHEGDTVAVGEVIAEIETDKASVEITAYDAGVLSKIVVPEGGTVPVGEIIATIGGPTASNGATASAKPPSEAAPVKELAAATKANSPTVEFSGGSESERVKASPLARRIARERGIDLARVHGSGPGGRVVERDVNEFQPSPAKPEQSALSPLPAGKDKGATESSLKEGKDATKSALPLGEGKSEGIQEVRPSRMREAIARRVTQSKQTVPHFYVTMVVGMDRATALLKEINSDAPDGKITINDLLIKACAVALAKVPEVNATWTAEGVIKRYSESHIGVAVGIDEGLIIPVVRNCESKTLRQISGEARELIGRARTNQLKPEEYSGGTFSISNLGMMGVDEFSAIINPPEAAILAIGGMVREPVVAVDSETISIRTNMKITISADHRLLDGVIAARFVQEVKKALEAPYGLVS